MVSATHSRKVDALIIGGGIIGLAIGYYLSKRNFRDVEIIERGAELTMHASGHNAGGLASIHPTQPRELWPLFGESQKLYDELHASPGFEFDYARNGTLLPGSVKDEAGYEKTIREWNGKEGIRIAFLDKTELKEREPYLSTERFSCAMYFPLDGQGNSKKLGACFAKSCLESGIKITNGTEVTGFEISQEKVVEVRTDGRGSIIPGVVVLAAGPWSGEVSSSLGLDLPISPVKGHLISMDVKDFKLVNSFIHGTEYYVMQNGSTVVVGGGEDSSGFDTQVDPVRVSEAWAEAISMVPELASVKGKAVTTACLRPFAEDGLPVLGRSKRLTNVLFATGHFRNGFGLAPATGKLISQLILEGSMEFDLSPFSPDRFLSDV